MKNKIFLMLILIFIIVLGTSCFAMTENDLDTFMLDFKDYSESFNYSWGTYCYNAYNRTKSNFINYINNYDLILLDCRPGNYMLYLFSSDSAFYIQNGYFKNTSFVNYCEINLSNDGSISSYSNSNITKGISSSSSDYLASNFNIYTNSDLSNIYSSNNYFCVVPSSPSTPTISVSNSVFTELSSNVWCTVNRNGYEDKGFIVLKKYNLNDEVIDYMSINYQFNDNYYDDDNDSWTLPLNSFYEFNFSNDYYYIAELHYDNEVVESDSFQVKFSDNYTVPDGGVYDLTPTITYYPESVSTSKTVTIKSPIEYSTIYYKTSINGVWVKYSEPFTVNQNCTIYAHCYDVSGQSASSHVVISNIGSVLDFNNRPMVSPKITARVDEKNGKYYAVFYIPSAWLNDNDISDLSLEWNINNTIWTIYPSNYNIVKGSAHYYYSYETDLPQNYSFRFVDSNGFYSSVTTFTLSSANVGTAINAGGVSGSPYDENGNFIGSSGDSNVLPSFLDNANSPIEYASAGSVFLLNIFTEIGDFFAIIQSLFGFLPKIVLSIMMSFLYVTFAIFIIGFVAKLF